MTPGFGLVVFPSGGGFVANFHCQSIAVYTTRPAPDRSICITRSAQVHDPLHCRKRFAPSHGTRDTFYCAMSLCHHMGERFDRADRQHDTLGLLGALDGRCMGLTPVPRDRRVIHGHATFPHECFDMARAQRVCDVPADAPTNAVLWKMGPLA